MTEGMNRAMYTRFIKDFRTGEQTALTPLFPDSLSCANIKAMPPSVLKAPMQKHIT